MHGFGKALLRLLTRSYSVYSVQSVVRRVLNHGLHGMHGFGEALLRFLGQIYSAHYSVYSVQSVVRRV